jgi:hypothetical protein
MRVVATVKDIWGALSGQERTDRDRAEQFYKRLVEQGPAALNESDLRFMRQTIGSDELDRRKKVLEEKERSDHRREEIPRQLRELETQCIQLHRAIPATVAEIEKTQKTLEMLERSVREQRDLLHQAKTKVESVRREGRLLGLAFPENPELPPRASQAPLPPRIPAPPAPDQTAKSKWIPESPRQPAWPTVTGA